MKKISQGSTGGPVHQYSFAPGPEEGRPAAFDSLPFAARNAAAEQWPVDLGESCLGAGAEWGVANGE